MVIIDASGLILGRLAAEVAKRALAGEDITIVNCEKAIITGKKKPVLARFKERAELGGPFHGPFYPRAPDRIVRRVIRGMLPHKKARGRQALGKVACYIGIPSSLKDKKVETIPLAAASRLKTKDYLKLDHISQLLGWKK